MASGALFGSSGNRSQTKNLVEFRAGRMNLKDRMVHPDKRKGLVYIYQADDSLMHFCWKDRTSGQVEDDLIIFPDDIEFKRISQCTTGRCYVLKFKSSVRRFFFWMQEPKIDKDEEHCRKVNEYLNNPPNPSANRNNVSDLPGLGESDLQNILGNMSQQQLMQLLGGMGMPAQNNLNLSTILGRPGNSLSNGSDSSRLQSSLGTRTSSASSESLSSIARPATAAATSLTSQTTDSTASNSSSGTSTASASSGAIASGSSSSSSNNASRTAADTPWQQIQLSDLQNILSNMQVPGDKAQDSLELSQVLKPDDIIPILANADIQKRLLEYLPEGEVLPRTEEELRNTVKSPQFQQALQSFSAALRSRELGPLMTQFGLGDEVAKAAAEGDLEAFVKALQEAQAQKKKD